MSELYAGVDIGGTTVTGLLASANGEVVVRREITTESYRGPEAVLERVAELVESLAEASSQRPQAVGVGVPGLVDVEAGTVLFLPNLVTQWRGVAAGPTLSRRLGCRVELLNDARAATLGELRYGHGRRIERATMALFMLGTGVGGGLAIDGKVRLGPLGAAGELGHQTVDPGGRRCGCGNRGCLETRASGPALAAEGIRLMRSGLAPVLYEQVQGNAQAVDAAAMARAADAGDEAVAEAIEQAGEWLGIGVANVVTVLHPQVVVVGGGVAVLGDRLLDPVRRVLPARVRAFPVDDIRVERSELGESVGALGAMAFAAGRADWHRLPGRG